MYFEAKAVRTGAEDTNKVNQLKKLRVQELYEEREKSEKEIKEGDEAEKVKKQKRLDEIDAAIRTMNIDPYGNALYFHSASEIKHMKQLEVSLFPFFLTKSDFLTKKSSFRMFFLDLQFLVTLSLEALPTLSLITLERNTFVNLFHTSSLDLCSSDHYLHSNTTCPTES